MFSTHITYSIYHCRAHTRWVFLASFTNPESSTQKKMYSLRDNKRRWKGEGRQLIISSQIICQVLTSISYSDSHSHSTDCSILQVRKPRPKTLAQGPRARTGVHFPRYWIQRDLPPAQLFHCLRGTGRPFLVAIMKTAWWLELCVSFDINQKCDVALKLNNFWPHR